MTARERLTTTISTKGQVVLPMAIRQALGWQAGTRLMVESTADGVLLRLMPAFATTGSEYVFGSLAAEGPAKTLADMDAGIMEEARRRHDRG